MADILARHPAPWHAVAPAADSTGQWIVAVVDARGDDVIRADAGMAIRMDRETWQLIRSAPELLEALKKYVDRSRRNREAQASDDPRCGGAVDPDELEREATALIVRIEGK